MHEFRGSSRTIGLEGESIPPELLSQEVQKWLSKNGVKIVEAKSRPIPWLSVMTIFLAAIASAATVILAVRMDWTGEKSSRALDGVLTGIAYSILPATCLGLYMAFGTGQSKARASRGLRIFITAPLFLILIGILKAIQNGHALKNQALFFCGLAVLFVSLSSLILWTSVMHTHTALIVPTWAAASFATLAFLFICIPILIVLPLILTRNNGSFYKQMSTTTKKPPTALSIVFALPYLAILTLLVPLIKIHVLKWPLSSTDHFHHHHAASTQKLAFQEDEEADIKSAPPGQEISQTFSVSALGYTTKSFRHIHFLSICCILAFFPTVLLAGNASLRFAAAILLILTPMATLLTAKFGARSTSLDEIWIWGTRYYILPTFAVGILLLHAARTSTKTNREWLFPTCVAIFGFTTIVLAVLLVLPCAWSTPQHFRFQTSTKVVRFLIGPWWLATLAIAGATHSPSFWAINAGLALFTGMNVWFEAGQFCFKAIFVPAKGNSRDIHTLRIPQRKDVFAVFPHALLILSVVYLLFNIVFVHFKIGGLGIVIVNVLLAPYVTSHGLDIMKQTSQIPGIAFILLPILLLCVIFFVHKILRGSTAAFMDFDQSYLSEAKAGALWLLFALPLSIAGWHVVMKASRIWTAGHVNHDLNIFTDIWEYYSSLFKKASLHATESSLDILAGYDHLNNRQKNNNTLWASVRAGFDLSTIHGEEAIPSFATLLCLVLLVPFGVLAPLGFLTKYGALGLSTEVILSMLGVSVILGVTVFAYACNASMERIRLEQKTKIAAFDLRLTLRRARVIASVKCARMLCEFRNRHYAYALQVVANEKETTEKLLDPRERFLAARVADFALKEDLIKASERYICVLDAAKQELDGTEDESADFQSAARTPGELRKSTIVKRVRHVNSENNDDYDCDGCNNHCDRLRAELSPQASMHDKELVYWKPSKKETNCMTLGTLATLFAEFQLTHDKEVRELQKKNAREEKFERRKTEGAAQIESHLHKMSSKRESIRYKSLTDCLISLSESMYDIVAGNISCLSCFSKSSRQHQTSKFIMVAKKRVKPTNPKHIEYINFVLSKFEALFSFIKESRVQDHDGSLSSIETVLREQINTLCSDDQPPAELIILERRLASAARWQLVRESLQLILEKRYRLRSPPQESNAVYLESLLPRAFCRYAIPVTRRKHACGVSLDKWLELLDDANIIDLCIVDGATPSSHMTVNQAMKIFHDLDKFDEHTNGNVLLPYKGFREAMRQTAMTIYPHLSEEKALTALGQKHIFARISLAPLSDAVEMGLLSSSARNIQSSRWHQIIETVVSSRGDTQRTNNCMKAIAQGRELALRGGDISHDDIESSHQKAAKRIGWNYGRQLLDGRQLLLQFKMVYTAAAEAIVQNDDDEDDDADGDDFDDENAPELTAKMLALLLDGNESNLDSKDMKQLRRLQDEASREKDDEQSRRRCGFWRLRSLFSFAVDKKVMGEAQMELELLKAGAEVQQMNMKESAQITTRPNDWESIVNLMIQSLRKSADATNDSGDDNVNQQALRIQMNIDNAFAVLELITDFLSFASIGFKGATAYGWGLERSCDFSLEACEDPETESGKIKSTIAFLASAPLMTLRYNTLGQFWFVVILCILTPFYLLEAVNAAREQRLGQNRDGSKLNIFSIAYIYLQSIKVLQATMPPIMTTLVSVLVCDACTPRPKRLSRMSTQCASIIHVLQLAAALFATLCYYPAISFIAPQLQFKSMALDLKFLPSYLVVLAQGKLMLAGAVNFISPERYIRNCIKGDIEARVFRSSLSLLIFAASLATFLAIYTLKVRPCIVRDFSIVRACSLAAAAATLWISAFAFMCRRYAFSREVTREFAALLLLLVFALLFRTAYYYASRIFGNKSKNKIVPEHDILSSVANFDLNNVGRKPRRMSTMSSLTPVT